MSSSPHYDRALRADLPTAIRLVREAQARLPLGDPTSTDLRFVTFEMTVAGLLAKLNGVTEADPSNEDKTIALREIMCLECHRPIGRGVAHIDCEAPNLGLVSDGHDYRAGSVDSAVATVVRAMGRPELTEEKARAWANALLDRDGPAERRNAVAAALLRAFRGEVGP